MKRDGLALERIAVGDHDLIHEDRMRPYDPFETLVE